MSSRIVFGSLVSLFPIFACCQASAAVPLPRYHLSVGQELQYEGSSTFKYQTGEMTDRMTLRIWVLAANTDGSKKIVLRLGSVSGDTGPGPAPEDATFVRCNLYPDGRTNSIASTGQEMDLFALLPPLPANTEETRSGWTRTSPVTGATIRCRMLPQTAGSSRTTFSARIQNPIDIIYGMTSSEVVAFNQQRGLVEKMDSANAQTYGFNGKGAGVIQLKDNTVHDAAWLQQFSAEADRFFTVVTDYQKIERQQHRTPAAIQHDMDLAGEHLKATRTNFHIPIFTSEIDSMLSHRADSLRYALQEAKKEAGVVGSPAADWSTTDLNGKLHSLKEFRGKVVIMDFWYRGCGWCMKAMPQIKAVAAHYQGRPVVVLGMNTDRKDEDAQFVVKTLQLNYCVLKAQQLPQKYGVEGFPTLLIIDQQGVVRDIHVGYSPTLKEQVIRSVDRLLGSAAAVSRG